MPGNSIFGEDGGDRVDSFMNGSGRIGYSPDTRIVFVRGLIPASADGRPQSMIPAVHWGRPELVLSEIAQVMMVRSIARTPAGRSWRIRRQTFYEATTKLMIREIIVSNIAVMVDGLSRELSSSCDRS